MVYALNKCKVDVACIGNHEFDPSDEQTDKLFKACEFPWLLGNILLKSTGKPIGDGQPFLVKEVNGKKIGFFGVGGEDWVGILGPDFENEGGIDYLPVGPYSANMCKTLREEHKVDIIVALTHLREVQDRQLPLDAPDIDLILGGHDHVIFDEAINNIPVVKSEQDFEYMSLIHVYAKGSIANPKFKGPRFDFTVDLHKVPIASPDEVDKELQAYVMKAD